MTNNTKEEVDQRREWLEHSVSTEARYQRFMLENLKWPASHHKVVASDARLESRRQSLARFNLDHQQ